MVELYPSDHKKCLILNKLNFYRTENRLDNNVKKNRELRMMSKAELARQANVSVQTIDRIEKGHECRLDTRRKIIIALGYKLDQKDKIFPED